jgi:beta-N-acetylhexosaminidase
VDQEGGIVNRLQLEDAPAAAELGDAEDLALVRSTAHRYAQESARRGIAMVLAPVVDLTLPGGSPVVGSRSFGSAPAFVSAAGIAFAQGVMAGGVVPVVKHYPGHGGTREDSHKRLAVLPARGEALEASLTPFYFACRLGIPAVMSGHIACPALDPSRTPASLSGRMLRGILRQHWDYDGLIITDDINMGAIGIAPEEAAVEALAAGNDMVMYCDPEPAQIRRMHTRIASAIRQGELSTAQLRASARRIAELRQWLRAARLLRYTPRLRSGESGMRHGWRGFLREPAAAQ